MHNRRAFSCGSSSIDTYFHEVAAQASKQLHAQTYVLTDTDDHSALRTVLGFYTLTPHEYRDEEMDSTTARALKLKNLRRIPAILLGQLGVTVDWQHRRLGPMLLEHAFRKALFASCCVGGALLVTDPIDDAARSFYRRFEFQELAGGSRLYLAMKTLAKLYPDVVAAAKSSVA